VQLRPSLPCSQWSFSRASSSPIVYFLWIQCNVVLTSSLWCHVHYLSIIFSNQNLLWYVSPFRIACTISSSILLQFHHHNWVFGWNESHETAHYPVFFLSLYFLFLQSSCLPRHPVLEQYLSLCSDISLLKTKRRRLYLKTQSVPRCKHFSSRL